MSKNYYEQELATVPKDAFTKIKISNQDGSTKWINLNDESLKAIINYLTNS